MSERKIDELLRKIKRILERRPRDYDVLKRLFDEILDEIRNPSK